MVAVPTNGLGVVPPRVYHFFKNSTIVDRVQSPWPGSLEIIPCLALLTVLTLFLMLAQSYFSSRVKSFPGPFVTNFTDLWRYIKTASGQAHLVHADLHRKYGSVVRIGPNTLSLSDPSLLRVVYNTKNPWKKSRMYAVQESVRPDGTPQPNLFSTSDDQWHATMIRPIGQYLASNTSILKTEKFLDDSISLLINVLKEKFSNAALPCDIADVFTRFSWDAMGYTTFGSSLGFLDGSLKDSEKLLQDSDRDFEYFARTCQMPWLHYYLKTNRIARAFNAPQLEWAVKLSIEHYTKRLQMRNASDAKKPASGQDQDFLDKYLEAQQKYPDLIDDYQMISYLLTNTVAGSHPTAYTLTAMVYYVLKTDGVLSKIHKELKSASLYGRNGPISYAIAKDLPYLEAIVREAIRIHPGFALALEREVPAEGLSLPDGRVIAPGTVVGMDAWVINRNEKVFGPEPDSFKPERWLRCPGESEDHFAARRRKMFNTVLSFGTGTRVCLGQHLALIELYKTAASFFANFDIELVDPKQEMKVVCAWAMRTEDVHLYLRSTSKLAKESLVEV
ncbi:benzoate 4-monooxygenase cytochrome P450, putative [Talaromyces stipitatus ATCC 10500]|uniref:Benzoate 4-monooxygenase cytochrome P450, putative n=1 Tax=Talaromyces stipitatus (strain ATCC 10500 / CBS 375.48 / QM 6759 / NRRL 1006) TaxID=441959 RepID=B8ML03_TALSN|nr:benzoate 4-monooxygenase cytochrome P450, putative [Talaromyces stipitatus ATCC 10500]EED15419.1 benzoate 4-monooxygenase cytochrome P450, putative [Talaromyces stipitatus ATCC 10500]